MGVNYNPGIVTNGLVLCLDAANPKSYSGSGSTWIDLSGNGNTGTLINSPTYNSANSGSFVFNGTNQYVNEGVTNSFTITTGDFSASSWIYPTAWADGLSRGIIDKRSISGSGWTFYNDGNYPTKINARLGNTFYFVSNSSIATNTWQNLTFVRSGSNIYWYYNGILDATGTNSSDLTDSTASLQIGHSQTWNGFFKGNLSNISVYNRALSPSEVSQNFNALRGRYGI